MRAAITSLSLLGGLLGAPPIASCSSPHSASKDTGDQAAATPSSVVLALDQRWGQAYIKNDFDFVDRLLSPDWRGWLDGKADSGLRL